MSKKRAMSEQAKDKKREDILMAALDVFYHNGFNATKMDDIARRVELSKGGLYLYFDSKEEIFVALIQHIALPKVTLIEQGLAKATTVHQGLSRLFASAPYLVRHSSLPKVLKILISDAFIFPEVVEHYRNNIITKALTAITHLLKKGAQQGEIHTDNPELTARLVVAPIVFSVIWTVVFESRQSQTQLNVHALLAEHQAILFKGLGLQKDQVCD